MNAHRRSYSGGRLRKGKVPPTDYKQKGHGKWWLTEHIATIILAKQKSKMNLNSELGKLEYSPVL